MRMLMQDLRYAVRMFAKKPGFTVVVVVTLGIGIGANTAMFSVVSAVVLRPLPCDEPDRLVALWSTQGTDRVSVNYPNFHDWRAQNHVFEDIGSYRWIDHTLVQTGEPRPVTGARVSAGFFSVLRVQPALGRAFRDDEDLPAAENVTIVSDSLWKRCLGADPGAIGQVLTLDGEESTVIGVLPPEFSFPSLPEAELWTPSSRDAGMFSERGLQFLQAIARLNPGVTQEQAQAEMDTIARRLEQQYPNCNTGIGVGLGALHEQVVGSVRAALFVLLGAVSLVLLVTCANVANLLLAHGSGRMRELAIRATLGASRTRLVRQLVTENLLLAFVGGAVGLLLAFWSTDGLLAFLPSDLPRGAEIGVDARVLMFALAVSLLTALVFGVFPAIWATRVDPQASLKEGGRASMSRRRQRLRGTLVIAEVALALVPLMGAGLLMRSFVRLTNVDPGFDPENLLTFRIAVPSEHDADFRRRVAFHDTLMEQLGSLPGVQAVGASTSLPLAGPNSRWAFKVLGRPEPAPGEPPVAQYNSVSPDFFRALRIPLLAGRLFTEIDSRGGTGVMIINESMAHRFWPDEDPIGQHVSPYINVEDGELTTFEIMGIVGDVRYQGLGTEAQPRMYVPHAQQCSSTMSFALRTSVDPASLMGAVRGKIATVTSEQAPYDFKTMDRRLTDSVGRQRFSMLLFGIFAFLALVLASSGIYGVLSYTVAQRTHEIGVRMAIGARRSNVLRQVLKQGFVLAVVGLAIGLLGSWALTRTLSSQLYEVSPADPVTFIAVSALLLMVALLACYLPARRATKVDPMVALRCE